MHRSMLPSWERRRVCFLLRAVMGLPVGSGRVALPLYRTVGAPIEERKRRIVKVQCPGCGAELNVPEKLAGKKGKCPKCGSGMAIPEGTDLGLLSLRSPHFQDVVAALITDRHRHFCAGAMTYMLSERGDEDVPVTDEFLFHFAKTSHLFLLADTTLHVMSVMSSSNAVGDTATQRSMDFALQVQQRIASWVPDAERPSPTADRAEYIKWLVGTARTDVALNKVPQVLKHLIGVQLFGLAPFQGNMPSVLQRLCAQEERVAPRHHAFFRLAVYLFWTFYEGFIPNRDDSRWEHTFCADWEAWWEAWEKLRNDLHSRLGRIFEELR